jgi:hypothetical protein
MRKPDENSIPSCQRIGNCGESPCGAGIIFPLKKYHIPVRGEPMAKVTREMVEKAGADVDHLVSLPVKNAAAKLTTFYYYTILRLNLIGLDGEGIKEIAEAARIEDRNHFEALVPRIYELGGGISPRI